MTTPITDKIDNFYFRFFPVVLMSVFYAVIFDRLVRMQLAGLLGYGGAFVTSLFAITSLLYARARAVSDPLAMARRAKVADESLKASLIAVMGLGLTSYVFLGLMPDYPELPGHIFDKQQSHPRSGPLAAAFLCVLLFAVPTVVKMMSAIKWTVEDMGDKPGSEST